MFNAYSLPCLPAYPCVLYLSSHLSVSVCAQSHVHADGRRKWGRCSVGSKMWRPRTAAVSPIGGSRGNEEGSARQTGRMPVMGEARLD